MTTTQTLATLLVAVALIAGCGSPDQTAPHDHGTAQPGPTAELKGAQLGASEAAGPYAVVLSSEPAEPTEGQVRFSAKVREGDEPVTDAAVELALSMPTMDMGGPTVMLRHAGEGEYEATVDLSMGGEWQAIVTVRGPDGRSGAAPFQFNAYQK
jgi:hypothetical protein